MLSGLEYVYHPWHAFSFRQGKKPPLAEVSLEYSTKARQLWAGISHNSQEPSTTRYEVIGGSSTKRARQNTSTIARPICVPSPNPFQQCAPFFSVLLERFRSPIVDDAVLDIQVPVYWVNRKWTMWTGFGKRGPGTGNETMEPRKRSRSEKREHGTCTMDPVKKKAQEGVTGEGGNCKQTTHDLETNNL